MKALNMSSLFGSHQSVMNSSEILVYFVLQSAFVIKMIRRLEQSKASGKEPFKNQT
jgi:hypothetical protein